MKCFLCKDDMTEGFSTYTAELNGRIIVIKDVPAMICSQCGEVWFNGNTIRKIEEILSSLEKSITPEIAAVKYSDLAA